MTSTWVKGKILQRKKRKGAVVLVVALIGCTSDCYSLSPLNQPASQEDHETIGRYRLDPNEDEIHPILCLVDAIVVFQVVQDRKADDLLLATNISLVRCAPTPQAVRFALQLISETESSSKFENHGNKQRMHLMRVSADSLGMDDAQLKELLTLFTDDTVASKRKRKEIAKVVRRLQGIRPVKKQKQKHPFISRTDWKVLGEWESKLDVLLQPQIESEPTSMTTSSTCSSSFSEIDQLSSDTDESRACVGSDGSDDSLSGEQTSSQTGKNKVGMGNLIINHPDPSDLNLMDKDRRLLRLEYLRLKKHPQVDWMVERVVRMQRERGRRKFQHIIDVGGGRGDLAVRLLQRLLCDGADVTMTIVDSNRSSLEAGRAFAEHVLGSIVVEHNMQFVCVDFGDFLRSSVASRTGEEGEEVGVIGRRPFDLVVGLHACGNLSDAALAFAEGYHASCLICPCCYNKKIIDMSQHPFPSSFSELGQCGWCTSDESKSGGPTSDDFATVQRLAESPLRSVSERSMRVVNSARLLQMKSWCTSTSLEEYDMAYSLRNQVLVGTHV